MVGLQDDLHGRTVMALRPSTRVQNLAYTGTAAQSAPFLAVNQNTQFQDMGTTSGTSGPTGTTHVRLVASTDCYVLFGTNPTATSSNGMFLPASSPEYFPVQPGDLISVVQSSAAGTLNITECF